MPNASRAADLARAAADLRPSRRERNLLFGESFLRHLDTPSSVMSPEIRHQIGPGSGVKTSALACVVEPVAKETARAKSLALATASRPKKRASAERKPKAKAAGGSSSTE
jgi:hypothetical protein